MIDRPLTFGEIFMAIREGDMKLAAAFALECLIMALPLIFLSLLLVQE